MATNSMNGSNMNSTLLVNGMGMTLKNGALEGELYSAESLREMSERNSGNGVIPSYSYTTEQSEQTSAIQYDVRDASNFNGTQAIAATPAEYVETLEASIRETMNGQYFKDAFHQTGLSCEFRPARTQPTPQIRHTMKPNSVIFNPSERFIDLDMNSLSGLSGDIKKGTLEAGAEIHLKPLSQAILFSASTRIFDYSIMGAGFTAGGLESTLNALIKDVGLSLNDSIVSALTNSQAVKNVQVSPLKPKRKLSDIAEDIVDSIVLAGRQSGFADNLSEMAVIVPTSVEAAMLALAQRNGFSDATGSALRDMLGTDVMSYRDLQATGAIFIAPKSLLMLSWRSMKDGSGDIFNVIVTRDPARQAWLLEAHSCIDLVADAFTTIKYDSASAGFIETDEVDATGLGNGQLADGQIKHIIRLTFDGAAGDFVSIPGVSMAPLFAAASDTTVAVDDVIAIAASPRGGIAPYSFEWKFKKGALPAGVTVDLIGTLNAAKATKAMAGEYELTVTDSTGATAEAAITLTVNDAVVAP